MEPNRIKEILQKIDAGGPEPLMPVVRKPEPVAAQPVAKVVEDEKVSKWKILTLASIVFMLLIMASYGSYLVYKNYRVISGGTPESVIAAVAKLTQLPEGEEPTVSTITSLEEIKDQPFFKDAQVGDKVVVFNQAKRAYIYRPSTRKLIGIAPLTQ